MLTLQWCSFSDSILFIIISVRTQKRDAKNKDQGKNAFHFLGGVAKKGKRKSMKALYFRHLFQNTARGVVHTVSTSGEKGEFCLCSLCADGKPLKEEAYAGDLFRLEGAEVSILLLENLHPEDLKRAGNLLRSNQVEQVLIPYEMRRRSSRNFPEQERYRY